LASQICIILEFTGECLSW